MSCQSCPEARESEAEQVFLSYRPGGHSHSDSPYLCSSLNFHWAPAQGSLPGYSGFLLRHGHSLSRVGVPGYSRQAGHPTSVPFLPFPAYSEERDPWLAAQKDQSIGSACLWRQKEDP